MKKRYCILYGYDRDIFLNITTNQQNDNTEHEENVIIIVEPRGQYIEQFKKEFKVSQKVILEPKLIISDKLKLSCDLYKKDKLYSIDYLENYTKRENVFCTTFSSLIDKYSIQSISNFIITFHLTDLDTMLKEFFLYHHFINNVQLQKNIRFNISNGFVEVKGNENENGSSILYANRNLDLDLPSICMYIIDYPDNSINKPKLLQMIKQYEIELLHNDELVPFDEIEELVESKEILTKEKFNIRMIPDKIENVIKKKYYDIIIQFNTKYFQFKPFFQLLYPLKENVLYIDQGIDIIYGTGKTMYKMYEMMYSQEFKEYMTKKREQKGKVYHFFEKKFYYEYLLSHFQTEVI